MKQSKTTLKELTHRYRAVLLKCALLNLAAFAVAMPAKAEDLVIDANSSKIINKTDTCSEGSCGGSYDKLNMTGGEFKIDRLNTDNDSVRFYFSDASTISGGKLTLSTPSDRSDDVDGISLSFGNGLTVTGSDTVLDFSGTTMIDLYDRNTKLSVTDATIYGHDTPTTSLFDVRGDASFTNTNIKLENSSLITWDDAISQKGETKTQEEYSRLSETDKQKYAQDPHYYGSEGQYREKIQLPESLGGGYPSDEDTIKYDLFKEIYTDRPDQTLNFTKGTLSLKDSDVVGGKNIILDGTEVTMNHSLIGPLSENNVAGKKLSNNLTIKENARLTAENKSVLLAGNFWSEYNQIGEYLVEKGIKTNAEILASIKPIASKANINIEGNAQVNLNDSSAIVLLDKNEGQVNLSGGQLNMNDKSSVFGQVVINGGKLNVNGQNSVKTRADFIVTPASETNNAELVFINESGDYYGFSAIDGTAPAINLQSGAINLNGTLTADINATGGAISFNNNSALNGKITGQLNKLTIAGGTFNDENNLVIDGNEDITVSGGTIISNNRGAVLQHQGTGNIVVTGGTFNNNTDHEANDIVHLGSGDIKISDGTFNNSVIGKFVSCANGYGYETCYDSSTIPTPVAGKVEISGGVFNNAELNSDGSDGLRITGGTLNDTFVAAAGGLLSIADGTFKDTEFTGAGIDVTGGKFGGYISFDEGASGINLSGGDFSNVSRFESGSMRLNIDSDKADLTLTAGKILHSIDASRLTITGEKGISIAKTVVKSDDISGKIIANKDSFVGGFDNFSDKWISGDKTVYSLWTNESLDTTKFDGADITLNSNAKAGVGEVLYTATIGNNVGDKDIQAVNITLREQQKLSADEIDKSVDAILQDLKRVGSSSKQPDDLRMYIYEATDVEDVNSQNLQSYIQEQWKQNKDLDYTLVEKTLREAYASYNSKVSESSARVNIAKSEITMNGTSGWVNGSAKDGNIVVSDNSTVVANGTNEISAKSGTVSFADSKLVVSNGANLTVATKDGNTLNLTNGTVDLSGVLNGNVSGGTLAFNSANARLNGKIANTGVEINTDIGFSALPTGLTTLKIAKDKTLDIGANNLTASTIKDGTISAILTDAAKNTAIVTATATDVTLKLDMSQASRDEVTQYKITNGTGFTFGDYATNRYAVSASEFDKANAKTLEKLSGWNGGDLWILRLATASEAAIEDLEKSGLVLPENEKNASKILDLASGILDKLPEHHKKVIDKVNDLLDKAQGKAEEIKQILREIAPDASTSGSKTASNTAKSVINVINSRFGGGSLRRGRSGGDYTVGQTAVWAQGMMNYAKLDTDNGFNAHSNGFAAGFEANFTDSFKAGLGYAYTSTDISTERSKTDVKTHTGFVYGEYKPNKAYINGVVSFGRSDYDDTTRSLSLTSAYKTDTIAAQIAAGYKAGVLTPEAAVRFTNVKQKAYTDATGAKMEEKTADTWTGVLGAKIGKNYALKANRKIGLSPELKVAATYDFARDDENRTVTLPDGSSYTATGEAMERFGVEAGAGVTVSIANSAEIALTYDGKFKKDYQDHTGMVNLKVKF